MLSILLAHRCPPTHSEYLLLNARRPHGHCPPWLFCAVMVTRRPSTGLLCALHSLGDFLSALSSSPPSNISGVHCTGQVTPRPPVCSAASFCLVCSRHIFHCLVLSWLLGIILANGYRPGLSALSWLLDAVLALWALIARWSEPVSRPADLQLLDTSLALYRPGVHRPAERAKNNHALAGWPVRYGASRRRRVVGRVQVTRYQEGVKQPEGRRVAKGAPSGQKGLQAARRALIIEEGAKWSDRYLS